MESWFSAINLRTFCCDPAVHHFQGHTLKEAVIGTSPGVAKQ